MWKGLEERQQDVRPSEKRVAMETDSFNPVRVRQPFIFKLISRGGNNEQNKWGQTSLWDAVPQIGQDS